MLILKDKKQILIWIFLIVLFSSLFFLKSNCISKYNFINQNLRCDTKFVINKGEYKDLKTQIKDYVDTQKKENSVDSVGIWFRDLEYGPTFGINEREDFIPASLLKLPLAMTYYDLASADPKLLSQKIDYINTKSPVPEQTFVPVDKIKSGEKYSIEELIKFSLKDSDNFAAQLLYEYLKNNYSNAQSLIETYRNLGVINPRNLNTEAVNAKEYGAILRILYNISFLDANDSNKILDELSQSNFSLGLKDGVPPHIVVSHKFGERIIDNTNEKELHDCGIVYYPKNPYLLCIMTKGRDFDKLAKVISTVSRMVYEGVDSRKSK